MANTSDVRGTQRDGGIVRPLLWAVLAIGIVGNISCSTIDILVGNIVFGLISLVGAVGLITHHYQNRR